MKKNKLRVVSLNTWADCTGKILDDVQRLGRDADVLCFQEVHHSPDTVPTNVRPRNPGKRTGNINTKLFTHIAETLNGAFVGYYAPQMRGFLHDTEEAEYPEIQYGNAMFVRANLEHSYRDGFIYGNLDKRLDDPLETPVGKTGQAIDVTDADGRLTIAHAHGAWYKSDKTTNFPWRDEQANGIIRLIAPHHDKFYHLAKYDDYQPRVIFVGDLNVVTATKTIKKIATSQAFGRVGGWHLNPRFGVWSTRTALYTGELKEADHAFASHNLNAKLSVDASVQSDHAALIVDTHAGTDD